MKANFSATLLKFDVNCSVLRGSITAVMSCVVPHRLVSFGFWFFFVFLFGYNPPYIVVVKLDPNTSDWPLTICQIKGMTHRSYWNSSLTILGPFSTKISTVICNSDIAESCEDILISVCTVHGVVRHLELFQPDANSIACHKEFKQGI